MRKEYVKPVMESEEFISNEYVATCWTLDCTKCDGYLETRSDAYSEGPMLYENDLWNSIGEKKSPCSSKIDKTTFEIDSWEKFWGLVSEAIEDDMNFFKFLDILINGKEIELKYSVHPVEVKKGWTMTNRPNAS